MFRATAVAMFAFVALASPQSGDEEDALAPAPQMTSEECLSCHGGTEGPSIGPEGHPFGVELRPTHQASDMRLKRASDPSGFGGTVTSDMLLGGRVECGSCHVDHETATNVRFRLRSANLTHLCLGCHVQAR